MRDRPLHDTLHAFVADAAQALAEETARGAEIPFVVAETESRRGRAPLYRYRPLTGTFISERMALLSYLATYPAAARAVAAQDHAGAYLVQRGVTLAPRDPRALADAVLATLLGRVFEERTEFELDPARFELAYHELELALFAQRRLDTVITPLLGVAFEPTTPEIVLEEGLSLVRGDKLADAPVEAVWGETDEPHVLLVLTVAQADRARPAISIARSRFRRVLTALRLFERGGYALGPLAWARTDAGAWRALPLGGTGRHRMITLIPARREEELRAFCELVRRRTPGSGEVAWALARFEMGCERVGPFEALTDWLLALRALLEPEGPQSGRLAARLAVLCAQPRERAALAERVARAIGLERAVVAGVHSAQRSAGADGLALEMAEHLRALLRDVLCGHLAADLVGVADRLLAQAADALQAARDGEEEAAVQEAARNAGEEEAQRRAAQDPEPVPAGPDPDPDLVTVEDRRYPSPQAAPHSAPSWAGSVMPARHDM